MAFICQFINISFCCNGIILLSYRLTTVSYTHLEEKEKEKAAKEEAKRKAKEEKEAAKRKAKEEAEKVKAEKKRLEEEAKAKKEHNKQTVKEQNDLYTSYSSNQNTSSKNDLTKTIQVVKR